jgi:hypothetical protein
MIRERQARLESLQWPSPRRRPAFSTYRTGQLFLIGLKPTGDLSVSIRPSIRGAVGSASPRRAAGRFDVARDRARILPRGGAVELDLSAGRIWRRLTAEERLAAGTEAAR